MHYRPLILTNSNWQDYRSKLHQYPLRISSLNTLESDIKVRSVSLKYVFSGTENYTLGKKPFALDDNRFVITNKHSDCKVRIDGKQLNTGVCVDLDENYFSDVIRSMSSPDEIDSLNRNISFFLSDELFSQGRHAVGRMKTMIQHLVSIARGGEELLFDDDFLRDITYEIVKSQDEVIREYNNVPAMRTSTKKELYERLTKARNILCEPAGLRLSVREISEMVCLSEFRFHHLYKSVFGISPAKFQALQIMSRAIRLFSETNSTWTELAEQSGYSDVHSFSKAFKKICGMSPENYRKVIRQQ